MKINRRKILLLGKTGLVGTSATVLSGALAFLAIGQVRYANKFYPGVHFDDEHIGGFTLDEVRGRVESRWDAYAEYPVTFRLGERLWQPSGAEVGINVDYVTPLLEAFSWGRLGGLFQRFEEQRTTLELSRSWRTRFTSLLLMHLLGSKIGADDVRSLLIRLVQGVSSSRLTTWRL